jgi:DNA-binding response OmpR family regulator
MPQTGTTPPTPRVLAVDDDRDILRIVRMAFEASGFDVATATSAQGGLDWMAKHGLPDLGVFDMNMPGGTGLELCQKLHGFCDIPVVFLTVVDDEETIVSTIDGHAEDYVAKPFRPRELVARSRRVLRRVGLAGKVRAAETRIDGRLSIFFVRQALRVAGKEVGLTPTETKILHVLVRSAPRIVGTDALLRRLWPNESVFEDTLRVHVHRLRQKIELNASQPTYILTHRALGYEFRIPEA